MNAGGSANNNRSGHGKAFDEVRNLLNRLDRSIDEARSKRLGVPDDDTRDEHARNAPASGQHPAPARSGDAPGEPVIGAPAHHSPNIPPRRADPHRPDPRWRAPDQAPAGSVNIPGQAPQRSRASQYGRAKPIGSGKPARNAPTDPNNAAVSDARANPTGAWQPRPGQPRHNPAPRPNPTRPSATKRLTDEDRLIG